MVVVLAELFDLIFEIAGKEVVFEQDAVLQDLRPAFDIALCWTMHRCAAQMANLVGLDVFGQFARDVAGTIFAMEPGLVLDRCMIAAGYRQRHVQRVCNILGSHIATQPPSDDVAREVVKHRGEVHPAQPMILKWVKSVCHILLERFVPVSILLAAFITTYSGLVMRSWAFNSQSAVAYDTK